MPGVPPVDFGKAWQEIEDPATITLAKLIGEDDGVPTYTYHTVDYVLIRAGGVDELVTTSANLEQEVRVFHLWRERLDESQEGLTPEQEDLIILNYEEDNEQRYRIHKMGRQSRNQRYRCVCTLQVGTTEDN